jgi:hypothetical protein
LGGPAPGAIFPTAPMVEIALLPGLHGRALFPTAPMVGTLCSPTSTVVCSSPRPPWLERSARRPPRSCALPHGPHGRVALPHGPHGRVALPHGPRGRVALPHGPHGADARPCGRTSFTHAARPVRGVRHTGSGSGVQAVGRRSGSTVGSGRAGRDSRHQ